MPQTATLHRWHWTSLQPGHSPEGCKGRGSTESAVPNVLNCSVLLGLDIYHWSSGMLSSWYIQESLMWVCISRLAQEFPKWTRQTLLIPSAVPLISRYASDSKTSCRTSLAPLFKSIWTTFYTSRSWFKMKHGHPLLIIRIHPDQCHTPALSRCLPQQRMTKAPHPLPVPSTSSIIYHLNICGRSLIRRSSKFICLKCP